MAASRNGATANTLQAPYSVPPSYYYPQYGYQNPESLYAQYGYQNPQSLYAQYGYQNPQSLYPQYDYVPTQPHYPAYQDPYMQQPPPQKDPEYLYYPVNAYGEVIGAAKTDIPDPQARPYSIHPPNVPIHESSRRSPRRDPVPYDNRQRRLHSHRRHDSSSPILPKLRDTRPATRKSISPVHEPVRPINETRPPTRKSVSPVQEPPPPIIAPPPPSPSRKSVSAVREPPQIIYVPASAIRETRPQRRPSIHESESPIPRSVSPIRKAQPPPRKSASPVQKAPPRLRKTQPVNHRHQPVSTRPVSPNDDEYPQFVVRDLTESGSILSGSYNQEALHRIQHYDQIRKSYR